MIQIDYSQLNSLGEIASSDTNGYENTIGLYNYQGVGSISNIETTLDNWRSLLSNKTVTPANSEMEMVQNFAAKMCLMKNRFSSKTEVFETDEGPVEYIVPVLDSGDIKWYLPAANEYASLVDSENPLNGLYWTSSAANDNTHAKTFTAPSSIGSDERMQEHKVRAARVRN